MTKQEYRYFDKILNRLEGKLLKEAFEPYGPLLDKLAKFRVELTNELGPESPGWWRGTFPIDR